MLSWQMDQILSGLRSNILVKKIDEDNKIIYD